MGRHSLPVTLALVAALLAVVGLAMATDNPGVSSTSRGSHQCLAPWDTVLNHADNRPGGEPSPDSEDIARRCTAAGRHRFDVAVTLWGGSALVAVAAGAVALVQLRRRRSGRLT